jgi:hypothetical protein
MGSILDEVTRFFNSPIPSSCTMAFGLTQPLTEIVYQEQLVCKADILTTIYEPAV